ncbi:hypothetical protein Tco_1348075, partial [Tanacetum coccineum]
GRKKSKPESTLDDSIVFDDQDADHGMEYMETDEALDEGRKNGETKQVKLTDDTKVVEDKGSGDKGGNAEELVSTARPEVSIARPDIDAARQEDSVVEPRTPPWNGYLTKRRKTKQKSDKTGHEMEKWTDYANLGNFIYKRKKGEKGNEKKKDVEGLFLYKIQTYP